MTTTNTYSGQQPRQDLSKEEIVDIYGTKNDPNPMDRWYMDNVRWGATFFNKRNRPVNDESLHDPWMLMGESQRAYKNMLYIQGDQLNENIGALGQVTSAGYTSAPWQSGKETWRFTNFIANNYLKILRSSKAVCKAYNPEAQSKITKKLRLAMLKLDQAPFFEDLAQNAGIKFEPTGGKQMYSKEQVEKFFFQNPSKQVLTT